MLKRISLSLITLVLLLSATMRVIAQVTSADYQRADSIIKLNDLVYHQINSVNWIDSTSIFWYQIKTREGLVVNLVDAVKMTSKPLFETEKLVDQLNKQTGIKTSTKTFQPQKLKFDVKVNKFHFEFAKAYWTCDLKKYALTKDSVVKPEPARPYWNDNVDELGNKPVTSPDSIWIAFVKNYNVTFVLKRIIKKFSLVTTVHPVISTRHT